MILSLSVCRSVCLSVCLSQCLSFSLSVSLSLSLSVCLSISFCLFSLFLCPFFLCLSFFLYLSVLSFLSLSFCLCNTISTLINKTKIKNLYSYLCLAGFNVGLWNVHNASVKKVNFFIILKQERTIHRI